MNLLCKFIEDLNYVVLLADLSSFASKGEVCGDVLDTNAKRDSRI